MLPRLAPDLLCSQGWTLNSSSYVLVPGAGVTDRCAPPAPTLCETEDGAQSCAHASPSPSAPATQSHPHDSPAQGSRSPHTSSHSAPWKYT